MGVSNGSREFWASGKEPGDPVLEMIQELTAEVRETREELRRLRSRSSNGTTGINGSRGWIAWMLGILAVLVATGIISSIRTYSRVESLETSVGMFRAEMRRDIDRAERERESLQSQLARHVRATGGGVEEP